jgi:hypothetical protein
MNAYSPASLFLFPTLSRPVEPAGGLCPYLEYKGIKVMRYIRCGAKSAAEGMVSIYLTKLIDESLQARVITILWFFNPIRACKSPNFDG